MGMNCIEKIICNHADVDVVSPGDIVEVRPDYVMTNDATTALNIGIFKDQLEGRKVWDPDRIVVVYDHYTPSNSIAAAEYHAKMRSFVKEQGIKNSFDGEGVCHQIMAEKFVKPGDLVIGADSHTCTYGGLGALGIGMGSTDIAVSWINGKTWLKVPETIKIIVKGKLRKGVYAKDLILTIIGDITASGATYKGIEFYGDAIESLSEESRLTLCNMAIEAGAKTSFVAPNNTSNASLIPDEDAQYEKVLEYDADKIEPCVACPSTVDNYKLLKDVEGKKVDELFIGACTNGRLEDLKIAAEILKDRKISDDVRLLVTPASRKVYLDAMELGLLKIFMDAGAMINNPGCSTCFGATNGLLGEGETLLSTANRNFVGRVGSDKAEIYLASPATVAASAIEGKITDPRRYLK